MGVCWSSSFRLYGKMNCFFVDPLSHVSTLKSKKKSGKSVFSLRGEGVKEWPRKERHFTFPFIRVNVSTVLPLSADVLLSISPELISPANLSFLTSHLTSLCLVPLLLLHFISLRYVSISFPCTVFEASSIKPNVYISMYCSLFISHPSKTSEV